VSNFNQDVQLHATFCILITFAQFLPNGFIATTRHMLSQLCLSVRLSVWHTYQLCQDSLTYCQTFSLLLRDAVKALIISASKNRVSSVKTAETTGMILRVQAIPSTYPVLHK